MEDTLIKMLGNENVFKDEMLSKHCTFGIGGKASFFVTPNSISSLIEVVNLLNQTEMKWKIIGNGSNLLFDDNGFSGVIISTLKINELHFFDNGRILVSSGVMLPYLAVLTAENGLSGIEFACSIPATVGGAIFMNAGAHGRSISDVIETVTYFNGEKLITAKPEELMFSYRDSIFKCNPNFVILSSELKLKKSNKSEIINDIVKLKQIRRQNQPSGKSAGSVFKAIDGVSAWKYIKSCNLQGTIIGDAEISTQHANFITNNGNASSGDVLKLIKLIECRVNEKHGKKLELEIEIVK